MQYLNDIIHFIRQKFNSPSGLIPLHEPRFTGNEKNYVTECIDTTYVSSIGKFVTKFEDMIAGYTGAKMPLQQRMGQQPCMLHYCFVMLNLMMR